uniref:Kinase n=1 Tax=Strigamia maritima TaxID=126957 RepID=T1JEJ5_STRMM
MRLVCAESGLDLERSDLLAVAVEKYLVDFVACNGLQQFVGIKVASDKSVDLSEILKSKKSETTVDKNKKLTRKWRSTAKHVLQGDWKKKDSTSTSSTDKKNKSVQISIDDLVPSDMTLLQVLALNALDLTAPASDILLKNRKNNWVQLSGHEGAFALAGPGTIWKKRTSDSDTEVKAYERLMQEELADFVPCFYKEVEWRGDYYIEMEDLLHSFKEPSVMDIKMGTRTFAESEVTNTKARADLYQKMVKIDPTAPTTEENEAKAVTKLHYMTFREQQSSSSTLGFRIEALKLENSAPVKDLKLVRSLDEVLCTMGLFLSGREDCRLQLLHRLRYMRDKLEQSQFFMQHEIVGSSILIVMDKTRAGAWMIDFVKTTPIDENCTLNHRSPWDRGNHEEGYLFGLDNLIKVLEDVQTSGKMTNENKNVGHEKHSSDL